MNDIKLYGDYEITLKSGLSCPKIAGKLVATLSDTELRRYNVNGRELYAKYAPLLKEGYALEGYRLWYVLKGTIGTRVICNHWISDNGVKLIDSTYGKTVIAFKSSLQHSSLIERLDINSLKNELNVLTLEIVYTPGIDDVRFDSIKSGDKYDITLVNGVTLSDMVYHGSVTTNIVEMMGNGVSLEHVPVNVDETVYANENDWLILSESHDPEEKLAIPKSRLLRLTNPMVTTIPYELSFYDVANLQTELTSSLSTILATDIVVK